MKKDFTCKMLRWPLFSKAIILISITIASLSLHAQNIALNKPATASSIENATLVAANAVDGNATTRWANVQPWTANGWIYVDLGATYAINRVVLNWETAFASGYQIQVSANATSWTTIYTTTTGNGATDNLTGLSGSGRYVRMNATARGTSYGYSLFEFQVYGTSTVTNGLKGEYFNNQTLTAPIVLTRTDATVNFDWTTGSPGAGVNANNFSTRWTGQVEAPATGSYTFSTVSDDGVRLWVNNVQVVNNWTDHGPTQNNGAPISLTAGQRYTIRMEYYENAGGAVARLQWLYPGQAQQIIPATRLFPTTGAADTQAPSVPGGLASSAITQTGFTLSWTASTDNVGVTGYDIYQGVTLKGSSTTTSFSVTGLTCNTSYSFTVRAKDAGGNISAASSALAVTTSACPVGDTQAPSVPANLSSSNISQTSFTLSWTASTDNVGVTGYDIYQGAALKGSATTPSFSVTGLICNTSYSFTVRAKDAAGNISAASSALSVTTSACATGISLTVNKSVLRQTMDGFGFFGARDNWWSSSDPSYFYTDAWLNLIMSDLGITIWRNEIYPHIPPTSNTTPNQDAHWDKQRPFVQALKTKADALGVDLKVILTVWSPPGSYKWWSSMAWAGDQAAQRGPSDQGDYWSEKNGGTLNPNRYNQFATWLSQAVQMYKTAGITPYAISPQNEPAFSQFFNSCTYTTYWYADMINAVIPQVKAAHPGLKVFGSENMLEQEGAAINYPYFYHNYLKNNVTAMNHLDRLAVHGYSDGVSPSSGSALAQYWTNHKTQFSQPFNKPQWMTETSGYVDTWENSSDKPGAFSLAQDMHAGLFYGDLAGWVWWSGSGTPTPGTIGEFQLMRGTNVGKKYHASKQFYRYIRPGSRRMETSSPDANVFLTAYYHAVNNTHTVVLLNTATTSKVISITGANLPASYDMYVTSATQNSQLITNVPASGITLPPRSVVTLQAGGTPLGGSSARSSIVSATVEETTGDKEIATYPNPVNSGVLNVRIFADKNEEATMTLMTSSSQPVIELKKTLIKGYNTISIPVGQKSTGLYFLKIRQGSKQTLKKVFIEK